jgi:APA family basic amino acid/polyamine antiporter
MGIIPLATLAGSEAPFADAATEVFGGTWGKWVAVIGMISAFGALNGWTLLTARISLAAAEDGLFPRTFARLHGKRRTPVMGLVAAAVLVTGLVFMNYNASLVDQFTFMLLLATLTTVVPYAFAAAAELLLFIREPERFTGRKMVRDAVIAGLGFGYALWAMYATGSESIAKGYILLMLGIPIFLWMRRRRQTDRIPIRTEHVEPTLELDETPVVVPDTPASVMR